jgi:hypothetical protein
LKDKNTITTARFALASLDLLESASSQDARPIISKLSEFLESKTAWSKQCREDSLTLLSEIGAGACRDWRVSTIRSFITSPATRHRHEQAYIAANEVVANARREAMGL